MIQAVKGRNQFQLLFNHLYLKIDKLSIMRIPIDTLLTNTWESGRNFDISSQKQSFRIERSKYENNNLMSNDFVRPGYRL